MKRALAALVALVLAVGMSAGAYAEKIKVEDYAVTEGLPEEWWNILLLGTDNRTETEVGRTDSMIILSVNMETAQVRMTSLMRDLWVPMYGRSEKAKLNAASVYGGPELTMRTINECFGMNISDYVLINITGMAEVIDILGGIEIDVTDAERKALNKGLFDLSSYSGMEELKTYGEKVHLNGNQAVAYARIRLIDSDYRRTERQREVLTAIAGKLQQNDVGTLMNIITSMLGFVETNLSIADMLSLGIMAMQMDLSTLEQYRIPADGTYEDGTYSGTWSIRPDFEKNAQLLYDFIYGEM